jgi:hypothetical protein
MILNHSRYIPENTGDSGIHVQNAIITLRITHCLIVSAVMPMPIGERITQVHSVIPVIQREMQENKLFMKKLFFLICIIVFWVELNGQPTQENLPGKVSFISSQNIYVKFKSTAGISIGDTLYIPSDNDLIPVLLVKNLSSVSCVCTLISGELLTLDHLIIARKKYIEPNKVAKAIENPVKETPLYTDEAVPVKKQATTDELKQIIKGSISANTYTDLSNTGAKNSNRFRYTFSLDARNIADSRFSVDIYTSFKYKMGDWSEVKSNLFNALKIYNLAVRYDLNKSTRISLGRRINQNISSIGAIDGVQFEKTLNKFSLGAIVGTRPDYASYGFNSRLLQYGAYVAFNSVTSESYTQSSLAFMQQMNRLKTDRRFLYFQNSTSFLKNVYLFSTFEIDLYKLNNDKPQSTFELTGLYLSLRYKMTRSFTITTSYDARKNVMYYETYKTFIDRILEDQMRQSFRLQADYRITRDLMFGVQSGYRFLKTDPHPSKSLYSYISYSQIPALNISVRLSGNYLESNFMNSRILGLNISRDFFKGKLQTDIGYRFVDYSLPENRLNIIQNMGEMNLSLQLSKNTSLSMNYEGTFEKKDLYNRIYLQIRIRF